MLVDEAFWRGKKVLLTGHTGFKGGWLSLWLQSMGSEILGLSLAPSTTPNLYTQARVAKGMQSQRGDIRDYDAVASAMAGFQPEIVIHMELGRGWCRERVCRSV